MCRSVLPLGPPPASLTHTRRHVPARVAGRTCAGAPMYTSINRRHSGRITTLSWHARALIAKKCKCRDAIPHRSVGYIDTVCRTVFALVVVAMKCPVAIRNVIGTHIQFKLNTLLIPRAFSTSRSTAHSTRMPMVSQGFFFIAPCAADMPDFNQNKHES